MSAPRIVSLCSGIGGLELGLERAGLGTVVAQSEIDPHASTVLTEHWDVPNLGDFRDQELPECEVLCAGFPCQPVSSAGRRQGTEDDRWLFDDICTAVGRMDPPPGLLVFENVRGLLSANDGGAMARVVEGLAALGFVGRYGLLRASDVGAPHRRERVFIAAHPADVRLDWGRRTRDRWSGSSDHDLIAPDAAGGGRADGTIRDPDQSCGSVAGASGGDRRRDPAAGVPIVGRGVGEWGPYTPAIHRWEHLTRPAPEPTIDGRLSPRFVEWMMGYSEGWVTDCGLTRTAALRCLGNAVVPQVAERWGRMLLGDGGRCNVPPELDLLPTPTVAQPGGSVDGYRGRFTDGRVSTFAPLNMLIEQSLAAPGVSP